MRPLWFPILVIALSARSFSKPTPPGHLDRVTKLPTTRIVVGAVADISVDYAPDKPVTFIHILEFSTDRFPQEPDLLSVRICGDRGSELAVAVHTDVSVVYKFASSSRSTGCMSLMSIRPWQDDGRWQTIVADSVRKKTNLKPRRAIRDLVKYPSRTHR